MKVSEELPEEVKLNELPTTLINYYLAVNNQAEKIGYLIKFL